MRRIERAWLPALTALALAGCAGTGAANSAAAPQTASAGAVGPARFDWFEYRGADPVDTARTPGADEYRNPILSGFYPDPSITRVGDDYYLVHSTFSYFPGIPIFHSRDLVTWRQIGNAIDRPAQLDFKKLGLSRGVFAPTIEAHRGTFYILNTCVDCGGNFLVTATDPAGPWSDPVWLPDLEGGIDPSLFFDDDGSAWILNNGPPEGEPLYEGHRAIWIQRFDIANKRSFGPRRVLVNGGVDIATKPVWIEGPHIVKKDGWYYLTCAEGGTAEGHSQVVLRSRSVTGPYAPNPDNPYLTQRGLPADRPFPITSAGHADMVQTQAGEWWATFLAVRPYRGDFYNTGRETFLLPVVWEKGWPRITRPGEVLPHVRSRPKLPRDAAPAMPTNGAFTVRDDFGGQTLGREWMMMRNPRTRWHRFEGGALVLDPRREGIGDNANPSYLGRRQQHAHATATTSVRFDPARPGDKAGLVALQSDEFWYFLGLQSRDGRRLVTLERRAGATDPAAGTLLASAPMAGAADAPVRLKITARGERYDFAYAAGDGAWRTLLADADGTILSTRTAGGFVGTTFGPYAVSAE